ncbi:MAG TPA: hypothetical protein DCO79_11550 [Spirochaeta sp.]|nr:hypothetical protein [Spirochaeta sp.]
MRTTGSIQVKVISVLLIILAVSVTFSIYFSVLNQRNNLLEASQQTLALNTQVLNHTIRNIMLSGEAPLANQTMGDLRQMEEFIEYEIYRRDGSLAFSNYETLDFVNDFQDRVMFEPTPRLEGSMIEDTGFMEVLKFKTPLVMLNEDAQEMEYYFPILNYADCRVCHGDDHFIRGISHFRISLSDVYAKVASARNLLTAFFLVVGAVIFVWVLIMLRRIVIRPVYAIGDVVARVGGGDLDIRINMKQNDELGMLSGRINQMIQGLKNSKLMELEKTRIEARLEESRKYLDNISEGLLLLNRDYQITDEFSFYLKELFETDEIAGLKFIDFIYGEGAATEQQIQEMEMFFDFLFNNKTAALSMIMEINPIHDMSLKLESGREIIIDAGFQRILEDDEVVNVMVLFQDKTDIIKTQNALEAEKMMRESELEQIAAILQHGPRVFEDFIASAEVAFMLISGSLDKLNNESNLAEVFRETHSLKGASRYLKFGRLEDISHQLESHFDALRNGSATDTTPPDVEELINAMETEITGIKNTIERFRKFSVSSDDDSSETAVFRDRITEMAAELAAELGKNASLKFETNSSNIPGLRKIQPALFHLVRNAIDHGVEDPFQRTAAGKPETAEVRLSFDVDEDKLKIRVSDDGRGIDFDAVELKAVEKGLLSTGGNSPSRILAAMFKSGFSSRDEVTSISGRGVGLDAVQADVHALKGQIKVKNNRGSGTAFTLLIPVTELES